MSGRAARAACSPRCLTSRCRPPSTQTWGATVTLMLGAVTAHRAGCSALNNPFPSFHDSLNAFGTDVKLDPRFTKHCRSRVECEIDYKQLRVNLTALKLGFSGESERSNLTAPLYPLPPAAAGLVPPAARPAPPAAPASAPSQHRSFIESRVTRRANCCSLQPSVPAGRSGITRV